MTNWAIDIDRDDVRDARIVADAAPVIGDGEALFSIDLYAMTANNITYAVFGKPVGLFGPNENGEAQGYWDFFAERDTPGRLPVWGFGTVVESKVEGVAPGDRFYGYWPMASHAVLTPSQVRETGFVDATPRRTTLPPIYNAYQNLDRIVDYRPEHHDFWPVFRPLFLTGWLIADQYRDEGDYGASQIVIASGSSKTAIGTGFSHKENGGDRDGDRPTSIALTSAGSVETLAATGIYDEVVSYDDIASLDASKPTGYVDIAGNGDVTRAVHGHFGDNLKYSMVVGKSHWDAPPAGDLAGPPQSGFFAPDRSQKRLADWGPQGFGERMAKSWLAFMDVAPELAAIDKRRGADAALAAYREVLAGDADPKTGIVVSP